MTVEPHMQDQGVGMVMYCFSTWNLYLELLFMDLQTNCCFAAGRPPLSALLGPGGRMATPCLRTVDLNAYSNYLELSAREKKFSSFAIIGQCGSLGLPRQYGINESYLIDLLHGSEFVITYEDKDGDWMLVGDVPWQ